MLSTTNRKLGLTIALCATLVLSACAPSNNDPKSTQIDILDLTKNTPFYIINGQEVLQNSDHFSYSIVALFNLESNGLCTGSIIDTNYILTAAHCMPKDPRNMVVFFGTNVDVAAKNKNFIPVADGIAHDNYAKTMALAQKQQKAPAYNWGDIALVKITTPLPSNYKPIPVVNLYTNTFRQETLLAGYGQNNGVQGTGSGILRKTIVHIENPQYSQTEASLDQTRGTGACHGDSGGPAYIKVNNGYALWGVTSRGLKDPNNDCSQFSVYTKITAYRDWIIQARLFLASRVLPPQAARPLAQK